MIKKEVAEIRKLFKKDKNCINRICGCYVDAEKNKVLTFKDAFLSLPEEETYKYFDLFKKTLSGSIGKNLLNLDFQTEEELDGGLQKALLRLRDCELRDEELLAEFYDKVIVSYDHPENYLILLAYGVYDIPTKDASDYVYPFLLCCLCPVALSKAGLCYNAKSHSITDVSRDWMVGMPEQGFLFPAFNDRNTDIHQTLYYTKKPEEVSTGILEQVLGCDHPLTAGFQKDAFQKLLESSLGDECTYEILQDLYAQLTTVSEEKSWEPATLDKQDLAKIVANSGVSKGAVSTFLQDYEETFGENKTVFAENLLDLNKFEIKAADVSVKVNPKRPDLVQEQIINGRRCLVVELNENIEVNGIPAVKSGK